MLRDWLIALKALLSPFVASYRAQRLLQDETIVVSTGTVIDEESTVGSYTYFGKYCYVTKARIGRYCSIGNNVSIGQGEHDLGRVSTSSLFYVDPYAELTKRDCVIGNDVWIGVDAIVMRGVTIGDGAVIGANAVVTRDVPPYSIVVGSPARVLRQRFDDARAKAIVASRWWEHDIERARAIILNLEAPSKQTL